MESLVLGGKFMSNPSGSSTDVRNRTWPVCPWAEPIGTRGNFRVPATVPELTAGITSVRTTPGTKQKLVVRYLNQTYKKTNVKSHSNFDLIANSSKKNLVNPFKHVFLPALVPIHSRSLHASRAVILRQAALCCLMIASAPEQGPNKVRLITDSGQTLLKFKNDKQFA